ncbi:MAG: hypothetical protein KDJ37_13220 [Hyphomicrobiaceae bacterium]|nr:hypothetical protein [Hyphomicrobiaceae bacterium]
MGSKISDIKHDDAVFDPEAQFDSPQHLVDEPGLTRGEKISALERWAHDVDRRLASGYEGMPTYGTEPRDAELLREIELAKSALKRGGDAGA